MRRHGERRRAEFDEDVADGFALEGQMPRHTAKGDDADRPKIRAKIDRAKPARLLRTHVVGRTEDGARARRGSGALGIGKLRDPEVHHLGHVGAVFVVPNEEDVVRLEIAVNDAGRVSLRESSANLHHDARRVAGGQPTNLIETLVERLALEKLHHDERPTVVHQSVVVDFDDVLAAERRGCPRFVFETPTSFGALGVLGVDELHRDARAERRVDPLPDRSHAAPTEHPGESVLPRHDARRNDGRRAI